MENISNEKTRKASEKEEDHFSSPVENIQFFLGWGGLG
jgi:hypothetical protein